MQLLQVSKSLLIHLLPLLLLVPYQTCKHASLSLLFPFWILKTMWWSRGLAHPRRSAPALLLAYIGQGWALMLPQPLNASHWWAPWAAPLWAASPRWHRAWAATPWTSSRCAPASSWPWLADEWHWGTGPSAHGIALWGSGLTCPFLVSSASFLLLCPSPLHRLCHRPNSRPRTYSPLTRHWGNQEQLHFIHDTVVKCIQYPFFPGEPNGKYWHNCKVANVPLRFWNTPPLWFILS